MATNQKLGCQKINTINILGISFLSCNIERHMRYQISTLPNVYKLEYQNQLPWLPGRHGNQTLAQNVPTF